MGSRGRAPGGGPGAKPLEASVHFNAETAFPTQTYIRKIVTLIKDIVANNVFTQVSYTQHAMPIIDALVERDTPAAKT